MAEMRCDMRFIRFFPLCEALERELRFWQRARCKAGPYQCAWLCDNCICLEEITVVEG